MQHEFMENMNQEVMEKAETLVPKAAEQLEKIEKSGMPKCVQYAAGAGLALGGAVLGAFAHKKVSDKPKKPGFMDAYKAAKAALTPEPTKVEQEIPEDPKEAEETKEETK